MKKKRAFDETPDFFSPKGDVKKTKIDRIQECKEKYCEDEKMIVWQEVEQKVKKQEADANLQHEFEEKFTLANKLSQECHQKASQNTNDILSFLKALETDLNNELKENDPI